MKWSNAVLRAEEATPSHLFLIIISPDGLLVNFVSPVSFSLLLSVLLIYIEMGSFSNLVIHTSYFFSAVVTNKSLLCSLHTRASDAMIDVLVTGTNI